MEHGGAETVVASGATVGALQVSYEKQDAANRMLTDGSQTIHALANLHERSW